MFSISFFRNNGIGAFCCLRLCLEYKPTIHLFPKGTENINLPPGVSLTTAVKRFLLWLKVPSLKHMQYYRAAWNKPTERFNDNNLHISSKIDFRLR